MKYFIFIFLFLNSAFLFARGGGGCFEKGTEVLTPGGYQLIENLNKGDKIISFHKGLPFQSSIYSNYKIETEKIIEIKACGKIVSVTNTHPFMIGNGIFKEAGNLNIGDFIYQFSNDKLNKCFIEEKKIKNKKTLAYNFLVYPYEQYIANGFIVHNKGCFLPDTFILKSDGSNIRISEIKKGDKILAFDKEGNILKTEVIEIIKLKTDEYFEIKTPFITLNATAEHPFYIGDSIFKTVESLKVGEKIYVYNGSSISSSEIISIRKVKAKTDIYNLKTDIPNTFFANFVAVHNKGGGCFAAGTKIYTSRGSINIEKIKKGDNILSFKDGKINEVKVNEVYIKEDNILEIETENGILKTTSEHPLLSLSGFKNAGEFKIGDKIGFYDNGLIWLSVRNLKLLPAKSRVYNISVDYPNTFIADGFIVHNKGGFGVGHYYGRSKYSKDFDSLYLILGIIVIINLIVTKLRGDNDEELDYIFPRSQIEKKSKKTEKLLQFISKQDRNFDIEYLKKTITNTFLQLQNCWQARDYLPMKSLLMPHLYIQHEKQLEIMKENHEINIMENLKILAIDFVGLRYTFDPNGRFVTALITAEAADYYLDDRNNRFLRGDRQINTFQEFWIF